MGLIIELAKKTKAKGFKRCPRLYFLMIRWRRYNAKKLDNYIKSHYEVKPGISLVLKWRMLFCWIFLGIRYWEFYGMHMDRKNLREILDFVPRWEEEDFYPQVNNKSYATLLTNKYECYEFFRDYYKRDCVLLSENNKSFEGLEGIRAFIDKHEMFIIKPLASNCGQGIEIVSSTNQKAEDIFVKHPGDLIIEEIIKQDSRMSVFHPKSVNTVRVFTINYGADEVDVKWPFFRIGKGDSVVDNVSSGGIGVAVDEKTGRTFHAADEHGHSYSKHPDTGIDLIDFEIPEWDALCQIVKKMAKMCPGCHVMGWDMALTDNGWCVVECNYAPGIAWQYASDTGARKDFEIVRKRLRAKKGEFIRNSHFISSYLLKPM